MNLLKCFYPYEYVEDVFSIDYQALRDKGVKGLIFDIDNTLVPHGADSTEQVDALFAKLNSMGFTTLLLSNNNRQRIERFATNISTLYIEEAGKPHPACYLKAVEMMRISKKEVVVIGDQLFTDIFGANRSGLPSILVKYIGFYKKEKKGIRRNLEKIVLWLYSHSRHYQHRIF
ncbi:MAG: YqeG family HAD IIIA-type phosphatase [Muribaculaceae bacterium]|nr:YqeG family HAD IIIA-type phosphatase [Muribaculaceae bacterium]